MNTRIQLEGTIHKIEQREGDNWSVRTVVLWEQIQKQDGTSFDKYVAVDFMKPDLIKIIDANIYPEGSKVSVTASVSSRNSKGNWWTSLRGDDIREPYQKAGRPAGETTGTVVTGTAVSGAVAQPSTAAGVTDQADPFKAAEQEEMPF